MEMNHNDYLMFGKCRIRVHKKVLDVSPTNALLDCIIGKKASEGHRLEVKGKQLPEVRLKTMWS